MKRILFVALLLFGASTAFAQSTAYSNQLALARDTTFLSRVKIAIVKAAIAIENEGNASPTVHAARKGFADRVLASPDGMAAVFAEGIVTQAPVSNGGSWGTVVTTTNGITTATTAAIDSDLDTIVSALWNAYSGPGALP